MNSQEDVVFSKDAAFSDNVSVSFDSLGVITNQSLQGNLVSVLCSDVIFIHLSVYSIARTSKIKDPTHGTSHFVLCREVIPFISTIGKSTIGVSISNLYYVLSSKGRFRCSSTVLLKHVK